MGFGDLYNVKPEEYKQAHLLVVLYKWSFLKIIFPSYQVQYRNELIKETQRALTILGI